MSLSIKTGAIKYKAGRLFDDTYNPGQKKQNLVCTMDDGSEEKLWFRAYRKPHAVLEKGERIQIIFDKDDSTGKVKRRLVAENQEKIMQRPVTKQEEIPTQEHQQKSQPKQSAEMFITERLAIYNLILERVKNCNFALPISDSDKSDIVTSILIEGTRKNINFQELLVTQDHIVPAEALSKVEDTDALPPQTAYEVNLDEIPF